MSTDDDIGELAAIVTDLADALERAHQAAAPAVERVRERAAQLAAPDRRRVVGALTVRSIEVVEPDGTVRLVASSRADFPTRTRIGGQPVDHPRDVAGMLFFNDDGDECAGLVFGGASARQSAGLTFDRYRGDQVIELRQDDTAAGHAAAVVINDQPDVPVAEMLARHRAVEAMPEPDRAAARDRLRADGYAPAARVVVGRTPDGTAMVALAGADGTVRATLTVAADGTPALRLLDEAGVTLWEAP